MSTVPITKRDPGDENDYVAGSRLESRVALHIPVNQARTKVLLRIVAAKRVRQSLTRARKDGYP